MSHVLLVKKILSSVVYNVFSHFLLIAQSLNEEQRCELVYYTVPKLSGVIGHWNGLLDPLFLFHAQSSRCTSWITLQEGLLDSC